MRKPKKILFPTDFSDYSKSAQKMVMDWAKAFRAQVYLLHVFELPFYSHTGVSAGVRVDVQQWIQKLRKEEAQRLEQLGRKFGEKGLKARTFFQEGRAALEILKTAEKIQPDLLILGTHGRTGVKHVFLGSVAESVVRRASCPVLTVRSFKAEVKKKG